MSAFNATIAAAQESGEERTIAISFPNLNQSAIAQSVVSWAEKRAAETGFRIILDDSGADINAQVNTILVWIQQGVSAIMVVAPDPEIFSAIAKQATDAGIVWITYAGTVEHQSAELNFRSDAGGKVMGEEVARWINETLGGTGKVAMLTYSPGKWAVDRVVAMEEVIARDAPGAEIVSIQDALSTIDGYNQTRTILSAHPDLNVVLAATETASEGAFRAMVDSGRPIDDKETFVGGIDGSPGGLKLVAVPDTIYRASVALNHRIIGESIVDLASELLEGGGGDIHPEWVLIRGGDPVAAEYLADALGAE